MSEVKTGTLNITNEDCMELMKRYPDKYFKLAIVDPPYGIGDRLVDGGGTNGMIKWQEDYRRTRWDNEKPDNAYFEELTRVSQNQIICGANYFGLPPTRGIIAWDKMVFVPTMSRWEYLWTSFDCVARLVQISSTDRDRIHPTQKPIKLYEWLLKNYAKEGDKILDTHLGSGSIAIACHYAGYDLTGCELDKEYYDMAMQRIKDQTSQTTLF